MPKERKMGYRVHSASQFSSAWGSDGELKPVGGAEHKVRWPSKTATRVHPKGHLTRRQATAEELAAMNNPKKEA